MRTKLKRLGDVLMIFEHELGLTRPSVKRAAKRALSQGYPRAVVDEVIDFMIITDRVPNSTPRLDRLLTV